MSTVWTSPELPLSSSVNNAIVRAISARFSRPNHYIRLSSYSIQDGYYVAEYQTATLVIGEYRYEYGNAYAILDPYFQFAF